MLIDYATSTGCEHFSGSPADVRVQQDGFVVAGFWEEHCIECGAPACYGTCEKFEAGPTGRCRRFTGGILPVRGKTGWAAVAFKEWGKLELCFKGRMVACRFARRLMAVDRLLFPFVRLFGCRAWYSNWRYRVLCHYAVLGKRPNSWQFRFYTEKPVDLVAAITHEEKGDLLSERLSVDAGWHAYTFDIPSVDGTLYFRISAINGTPCPVVFDQLEVGTADTSAKKEGAKFVKCVAWDLDNTVWDGVLVNDGPEGVKLRQPVVDVIKQLDQRGVLNSICSKNDYEATWKKLTELGLAEYFVFPQINWMPKSANLQNMAREINIGIDAIALVDDSDHERGEVGENLPMVRIYKDTQVGELLSLPEMNPPVSAESSKRRFSYLAEMTRRQSAATFAGDHAAFLKSCEIKLKLLPLDDAAIKKRCWELVNRTNQLTLAARRYTEESFQALLDTPDATAYAIHCKDKYGDYGIVGFVAVRKIETTYEVSEFVMSCRVAKKQCEFAVVNHLATKAMDEGGAELFAEVVSTGRNKALIEAFDEMPGIAKRDLGERIRYSLSLKGRQEPEIPVSVA